MRLVVRGHGPVEQPVRRGVSNFFSNFADAWSAINNMLQGKIELGFEDATRVGTNTLFGLFGILDVASEMIKRTENRCKDLSLANVDLVLGNGRNFQPVADSRNWPPGRPPSGSCARRRFPSCR